MRKTLIAAAMLATFGVTQAQTTNVDGGTTASSIISVGISNVNAQPFGPHKPGYPGVSPDGSNYIDLDGISTSSRFVDTVAGFNHYYLPGYTHTAPGGGTVTTHINWVRIPSAGEDVYFGLATNPGSSSHNHAAYHVGDRTGYAVPASNTSYSVGGLLATPGTAANDPVILTGTLSYVASYVSVTGTLSGTNTGSSTVHTLGISATDFSSNGPGTFNGTSTYSSSAGASGSGVSSGHFYGNGAGAGNSTIAGIANSTSGDAYVASFGGKN